jgi:probable rRNA maturation factor
MPVKIQFVDQQVFRPVTQAELDRMESVLTQVALDHGFDEGEVSVAILDDATIQDYNRKYLEHDYPTDVISFLLSEEDESLDGQLLISRETADLVAQELPWTGDVELLLYAIHGMLHLVGYDDADATDLEFMRAQERRYLLAQGIEDAAGHPHFDERAKFETHEDKDKTP